MGSLPCSEPLVSRLRYASQEIQIRHEYLHPGDYQYFKAIQGNTITQEYVTARYIVVLRGAIVIRTQGGPKKLHIPLFSHTILGPDYYVPP